ncbi:MAG: transporter substrate-binding domain-containing protein [Bacteroidales bacterium]|nr:transporter substrate-binding domain-containing protein [Bacteroidales bacterium]
MKIIFTATFILVITFSSFSQNDTIIVSGDYNYPPFSFIDKDGKAAGYDIDVINAIAEITGLNIKFKLYNWDTSLLKLKNGEVDVVTSIVYYSDREKIYDYSFPLHTEYYAIFTKDSTRIEDINDLEKKKPAILPGDISNELFYKPMGLYKNYLNAESFPKAFSLVNSGDCDYVIAPYSLGMEIIEKSGFSNIIVKGDPIIPSVFCFAVKEDNYELLAWINQGIEILSRNGDLDKIYKKWVKYKRKDDHYKDFFYYTLFGLIILAGIIFILVLFWYSLKKQVRKKTIEIKKSEVLYENIFNSVDDGLILLDESETIIAANKKACSLLANGSEQLVGKNISKISYNANDTKSQHINQIIKEGKTFFEDNIQRNNGNETYHLVLKGFKIDLENKQRYLIVIHDITKERINLIALKEAKKNADNANKAKGTFLSTISHEIRTPLFAVIGFTELMAKTRLSEKQHDYNKKIQISGKLLLNLVNDILDLTKLEAEKLKLNPEIFSIHELIDEIFEVESLKANEKHLKLDYEIGKDVPDFLIGDKLYLSRIIMNVLNNAIKFTSKGKVSLLVNVENIHELPKLNEVRIIFSIKDTGIGISMESQKKLFKPFEQIQNTRERSYGGSGLGLALSKQLVEQMNGEIILESTEGKGSVFNICIPLKIAEKPASKKEELYLETEPEEIISVLLVEDNDFNAEILLNQLSEAKFEVKHASSGYEAIDILKSNHFQIILMDIEMPGMDGFATLKKIRASNLSDAPAIALSAHNLASEKEKALSAGMLDYLNKPIAIEALSKAIYKYRSGNPKSREKEHFVINKNEGLTFFDNDKETYNRALLRFKKHYSKTPEELTTFFENDFSKLKDQTHNLKSAAKTIGATLLFEMAQNSDLILRTNSESFTLEHLNALTDELKKVLTEIEKIKTEL